MKLTLLGTGTLVPEKDRGSAGFLLQYGSSSILVDSGSGTIHRLSRAGYDVRDLDGLVYTHRHLDHIGDLPSILFTMRCSMEKPRTRDLPIWGGSGIRAYNEQLLAMHGPWIQAPGYQTPVHELPLDAPGLALLPEGVELHTLPANHPEGALHLQFLFPNGKKLVFSGDTGPSPALAELAHRADLFICECALAEQNDYHYHLRASEVASILARARPRRTVLTHFYPELDPEQALLTLQRLDFPVERGADQQVLFL